MTEARIVLTVEGKKLNNAGGRPAFGVTFHMTHDVASDEFDPKSVDAERMTKGGAVVAAVAMIAQELVKLAIECPFGSELILDAARKAAAAWDERHGFGGETAVEICSKEKMEAMK